MNTLSAGAAWRVCEPPTWTGPALAQGVLEVTDAPDPADHARVFRALADATAAVAGPPEFRKLAVLLRNDDGTVSGGLWGVTAYGWLQIMTLFVPEPLRGRGVGQGLMALAEAEARARRCIGAQVDAFDFQAAGFYARLGYTPFGIQENHPPGRRRVFLAKQLDDDRGLQANEGGCTLMA